MLHTTSIHVREDGTVNRPGIETPKGTKVVKREGDILVIKVPGHNYWSGIGQQSYAGAEYEVYRVIGELAGRLQVEGLTSFSVRA